jgi:prepilin-type N-terminal cleavage/methylation domain-containing protein
MSTPPKRKDVTEQMRLLRARSARDESGFTLVELVMGLMIFSLVATGIAASMTSSLNVTRQSRNRSIAANLAAQEMDTVRSTTFTSLPVGLVTSSQSVDGVPYTINRESEWIPQDASTGPCQAPLGSTPVFLRVGVNVIWTDMGGVSPVRSETIVTPPVGTFDPNSGHIAVSLLDGNAQPVSGVLVTATGPGSPPPQTTTSDGCAFFAYQPAGAYTVALSRSGYVDDQGVTNPAKSVTVGVGTTIPAQFSYDDAATLQLNMVGNTGFAPPSGVQVTIANTHFVPSGVKSYPGTGNPRQITGVFPWGDGYSAWAGNCADADPEGESSPSVPYYPGAVRPDPIETLPGSLSIGTILMPEVRVNAGAPGRVVTAVHAAAPGCLSGSTLTLGTSGGSGFVNAALPYGTWNIKVNGSSIGSRTLSPLDPPTPVAVP